MLFRQALASELRALAAAVFATLLVITTTLTLIRVLGQAASGRIDPQTVFVILGYTLLNYTPTMLNLAVFSAVLLVLTRMYRDSEMIVWSASGLALTAWIKPVLRFAFPVLLLGSFISLAVAPWANQQAAVYKDIFEKRDDVSRIASGQFRESSNGNRVFYVQQVDEVADRVHKVFIRSLSQAADQSQKQSVVVADTGHLKTQEGQRFLILEKGRRYDLDPRSAAGNLMEFERYIIRLDNQVPAPTNLSTPRLSSSLILLKRSEPAYQAELMWRIGVPFVGLVLSILAIPLSFFNPRSGRATPFIVALLVFITYVNLLTLSQNQIAQGRMNFFGGLFAVHLFVICISAFLIWLRSRPQSRSWRARFLGNSRAIFRKAAV